MNFDHLLILISLAASLFSLFVSLRVVEKFVALRQEMRELTKLRKP